MSALAQEHNAINLSQGFPDFAIDAGLTEALADAARSGYNQYAPMAGLPQLRQQVANGLMHRYGVSVDAEHEVTITPGATYAIYTAFTALLQPGDEVIVLEPAYDSYIPNIEMNGARAVTVALEGPTFSVPWDKVAAAVTARTAAIIINTPHNPTGATFAPADWEALDRITDGTDIVILSDEVYEQLVFDGAQHISILQHPALRQRSFVLYSFGKVYNNTGWKIGYCIAPPAYTQAFRRIHQFLSFTVNTPCQYALAAQLAHEAATPPVASIAAQMQERRDYFLSLLAHTPFTIHAPAQGSYFQVAGYSGITDMGDREFATWLTREYGVATIPVSAFYRNGHDEKLIRFCFAKKKETLSDAVGRLKAIVPLKNKQSRPAAF